MMKSFSDFLYTDAFRKYSPSKSKVVKNRPKFCMFWSAIFLGGVPPNFWTSIINAASHHVAKFHGGRPRELGDPTLKKNITGET